MLALAVVAVAALLLRPWGGATPAALAEAPTSAPDAVAVVPTSAPSAPGDPTLGPHGDPVTPPRASAGEPPAVDDHASWRDRRPAPVTSLTGYRWPIEHARITNSFGVGRPGSFEVEGVTYHDGLDVSSFCGARIVAAHDGVVLTAGRHHEGFMGWVGDLAPFRAKLDRQQGWGGQAITVVVDDGNGYRSIYAHLGLEAVDKGDRVKAGQLLGYEGASGNATGCHLHFAIFSPLETRTVALEQKIADKTKLPGLMLTRIDPLSVLPPLADADIAWGWGAR